MDCEVWRSLRPRLRSAYLHVLVKAVPRAAAKRGPGGLLASRRELAEGLGHSPRTVARYLQELEEYGLIEVSRTTGGAHGNRNRYWALEIDRRAPPLEGTRAWRNWLQAQGQTPPPRPTRDDRRPKLDVATEPAAHVLTSAQPAAHVLTSAQLAELIRQLRAEGLEVLVPVMEMDPRGAFEFALDRGIVQAAAARPATAIDAVAEWLAGWGIQRPPKRCELALVAEVQAICGDNWYAALVAANAALVQQRRNGRGQDPYAMTYLRVHLQRLNLLGRPTPEA